MTPLMRGLLPVMLILALGGCAGASAPARAPLRIATWNLEHLAEQNGAGCRPRTDADYAVLRSYAERLDADVVAFEEVESLAAASRVFAPERYDLLIENRPPGTRFPCNGGNPNTLTRQAVGFAIRKGLDYRRGPDVVDLQLGDPNLRGGVDVTIRPRGHAPLRMLAVHLKSGCASGGAPGAGGSACQTLMRQVPILERWIDARAVEPIRYLVLGDFNRRLARPGDVVWSQIDDADPPDADLSLAEGTARPQCDPRFSEFIDHIVLGARAQRGLLGFEELTFAPGAERPSDHCPVLARLN